jgi:hypothetical protein
MVLKPVFVSRSISSVLIFVGTRNFSFCSPSRGETSTIRTDDIARKQRTRPPNLVFKVDCTGRLRTGTGERPRRRQVPRPEMVDDGSGRVYFWCCAVFIREPAMETAGNGPSRIGRHGLTLCMSDTRRSDSKPPPSFQIQGLFRASEDPPRHRHRHHLLSATSLSYGFNYDDEGFLQQFNGHIQFKSPQRYPH